MFQHFKFTDSKFKMINFKILNFTCKFRLWKLSLTISSKFSINIHLEILSLKSPHTNVETCDIYLVVSNSASASLSSWTCSHLRLCSVFTWQKDWCNQLHLVPLTKTSTTRVCICEWQPCEYLKHFLIIFSFVSGLFPFSEAEVQTHRIWDETTVVVWTNFSVIIYCRIR